MTALTAIQGRKTDPPGSPRAGQGRGRGTRYRLMVLAEDTSDAVASSGGLIFDAVRAGWHVDLYLETGIDERPLRVLGVGGRSISDGLDYEWAWPDAIFLAAPVYARFGSVRKLAKNASRRRTDVAVWGQNAPADLETSVGLEHRLSTAAQAFKCHALQAAGATPEAAPVETFRTGQGRREALGPTLLSSL